MTSRAFYLQNHSASELHNADVATLPALSTRPTFPNKADYAKWCHDSSTRHVFYGLGEPESPNLRSSAQNQIKFLHGIVADYDGDANAIQAALPQLSFAQGKAPAWVTTTFSNKARLIWLFEERVPVFSPEVLSKLLAALTKDLQLKKLLPGLDEGALLQNPHTPMELGTDWRQPYGDPRIPKTFLMGLLYDICAKAKWVSDSPEIPLETVAIEVEKRWPGRWLGPFEEGARGIRFWDSASDNPTGCTIRAQGAQAWTGECKFMPWAELLGADFVKQFRANRIGQAIAGVYFDGRSYWMKDERGEWGDLNVEAAKRHLGALYGLSAEQKKGQQSELSLALTSIDRLQRIEGASPRLFTKGDLFTDGSSRYLNIARARPVLGSGTPRVWGDGFPWLAAYLDGLFCEVQRPVFLSWLAWFYQGAIAGKPRQGQALFVAGPASAGKTFLSQRVIGGLMGGFQEATSYVTGATTFNEQLFQAPIWAVDDAKGAVNAGSHRLFSDAVKRIAANPNQEYSPKFKKQTTFRFCGRLVVTLNTDAESSSMLPATDNSILDKLIVLRAEMPGVRFLSAEETVERELPAFADFIGAYVIPDTLKQDTRTADRFGLDGFFHSDLLDVASDANPAREFYELLDLWRKLYFRASDRKDWSGNPTELWGELHELDGVKGLVPSVVRGGGQLGRYLSALIKQNVPWLTFHRSGTARTYSIARPALI